MTKGKQDYLSLRARFSIFLLYLGIAYFLHGWVTGWWEPRAGGRGLWLLSVLGLLTFRLLTAPYFIRPKDSFAISVTGFFILWSVDFSSWAIVPEFLTPVRFWSAVAFAVIAVAGGASILLKDVDPRQQPFLDYIRSRSYWLNTTFGVGEVVFTIPALIGIVGFYSLDPGVITGLTAGWIVIATVEPVEKGWRFFLQTREQEERTLGQRVGSISRVDSPGIVRVSLEDGKSWQSEALHIGAFPDGTEAEVLPLFSQVQDEGLLGTGICIDKTTGVSNLRQGMKPGGIYRLDDPRERRSVIRDLYSFEGDADLVGFIVERSNIGTVRFEVASDSDLREGQIVFCEVSGRSVFYQIIGVETAEESFERNPRGTQIVKASQLGAPQETGGFDWYAWVPKMNSPVFRPVGESWGEMQVDEDRVGELVLGGVPGTPVEVRGRFNDLAEFHTAVLGMTGMGKTELVFDIIRHGYREKDAKILCVDFTGEYKPRLDDLGPQELGFTEERIEELAERIEDVETGQYGAAEEKAELYRFLDDTRPEVATQVDEFLSPPGGDLGIFKLEEIANTRATLRATEMYISEVFKWARRNRGARQILLVLEEAHTIIPEMNLFRYDNSDTEAVVGRMSQIALQGRKYGVGLLLVSQRTALVRKTILSQCNTYLSFSLVDQTSLKYLRNVYGRDHVELVPDLRPRQVLAFGKGVSGDKPIMFEIPFDQEKLDASEELRSEVPDLREGPAGDGGAADRPAATDGGEMDDEPIEHEEVGEGGVGGDDELPF